MQKYPQQQKKSESNSDINLQKFLSQARDSFERHLNFEELRNVEISTPSLPTTISNPNYFRGHKEKIYTYFPGGGVQRKGKKKCRKEA